MYEHIPTLLSRCIEAAEFFCEAEGWKGYVIGYSNNRFVFCPLNRKNRERYGENTVVIMKRKKNANR